MYKFLALVARAFISLPFIAAGISNIFRFQAITEWMQLEGLSYTTPLLIIALVIELVCGLAILIGIKPRLSALILFIFLVATTCMFHLNLQDHIERTEFLKNLAILGGLLLILLHGAGPWSISSRDY